MSAVVSDSSPLIYLALLSDFSLLREIYGSLVIPPAVHAEVVANADGYPVREAVEGAIGNWIEITSIPDPLRVLVLQREHGLDLGESEAITIAEELGSVPLLMDDQVGVRCARSLGFTVIRTPLIYAEAKFRGLIPNVKGKLDELRDGGFRLSDRHYHLILKAVGEGAE